MDLNYISECVSTITDDVICAMDSLYIKQLSILEYDNEFDGSTYDCFQEGFIKPSSKELNVFKFENTHILKAIKCFNKAYAEIPLKGSGFDEFKQKQERGELNIKRSLNPDSEYPKEMIQFIETKFRTKHGYFDEGFQELQKQFDCKFKVYISQKQGTGTFIEKFPKDPGKLTISRKKGFQLGGLGINLNINIRQLLSFAPSNPKLFGQSFTAVILHEIYHNIVHMIDVRNAKLHNDIKNTMSEVSKSKNVVNTTAKLSLFVERFISMFNLKKSDINKERAINRLYVLSQIQDNPAAMKKFEEDIKNNNDETNTDGEIDQYIDKMRKIKNLLKIGKTAKVVSTCCSILLAAVGFTFGNTLAVVASVVHMAIMSLGMLMKKVQSLFGVTPFVQEEYFCDLFAAMYKLPIHLTSYNRQIALNKKNADKMTELRKLDQKIDKILKDEHPITFDREVTSYKLAKQILQSEKHLKKDVKEYLKYIVELHEGIDEINNPDDKRQARKLSPESAADLQKTLKEFISKTGAVVTESFITDMCNINGGEYYGIG